MTPRHLFTKQASPLRKAPLGQWVTGQVSGALVAPAIPTTAAGGPVAQARSPAKTAAKVRLRMGLPRWLPRSALAACYNSRSAATAAVGGDSALAQARMRACQASGH